MEELVLADTSIFSKYGDEDVVNRFANGGVDAFLRTTDYDFQQEIEYIDSIRQAGQLTLTEEVKKELERRAVVIQRQIDLFSSSKGSRKKTGLLIEFEEYKRKFEEVINLYNSELHIFSGEQGHLYNIARDYANQVHCDRKSILKRMRASVKLGDRLNTDNKLIATSIARGMYQPVMLLTHDGRLEIDLYKVMRKIEGHPGLIYPFHPVRARILGKFLMQRGRNSGLKAA